MLPYVTSSLPGIGGCLRATPDDFVVEEIASIRRRATGSICT
ncbi:MAG: hypothetical protein R3A10_23110 [Caldilineaceae bacterium]